MPGISFLRKIRPISIIVLFSCMLMIAGVTIIVFIEFNVVGAHHSEPSIEIFNKRLGELYSKYLHGNTKQARLALIDSNKFLLANTNKRYSRSNHFKYWVSYGLWSNYCRLYILDARVGNIHEAGDDLANARHWYPKGMSMDRPFGGDLDVNITKSSSPQAWAAFAKEWDKRATHGKGPAYLQTEK